MTSRKHSDVAVAFTEVVRDIVRRVPPKQRPMMAVVMRSGERPHLTSRADLVGHLKAAGLDSHACDVARRRVPSHCVLVWIESDESTGVINVPVFLPDGAKSRTITCHLPTTAVLASLMGIELETPECSTNERQSNERLRK